MKKIIVLLCLILSLSFLIIRTTPVYSDELDDITKKLNELQSALSQSQKATAPLLTQLNNLQSQVKSIENRVAFIENEIASKKKIISASYVDLAKQKVVFDQTVRSFYIKNFAFSPLVVFISAKDAGEVTRILAYQKRDADQDKAIITNIAIKITDIIEQQKQLENEESRLSSIKEKLAIDKAAVEKIVVGAQKYQADLSGQIAQLSEKQKSIISARSGSAITSVGSVPIGSDYNASIAFKSSAPGNTFAVFSFGGYTHRNGMSQYGAKKQAESKNYKDIIQWYYGHGVKKDEGMATTIDVQGHGTMDFQTYLYGIAEMPSDWPLEALKAQAVAARTYANRTGKPICTTEACQVFLKSKSDNPPASWKQAVDETSKEIIDGDVSAQYSSTAGGYSNTTGWDTTDKSNSGDWTSRAWESLAGSPWFYKAWYRQGYTNSGNSCGRNHPWLSQEEMSDIINAWIVRKNPNGADVNRIVPTTIQSCPFGSTSGDPYSMSDMRDKANNSGGAVTSITSVTTSNNNNGQTTTVRFQTNRGEISIPGSEFKETFNVRAPGYIAIPQSGFSFFNVEKN
jgi:peptidoglycan hydrolase-like amidase